MDLKSGTPFWTIRNGLIRHYPRLTADTRCDVAIMGAGITGAIIADELVRRGMSIVVLDACEAGWGSTAASTALVQGEIDTDLLDLARIHGERSAVEAYRACADAVSGISARFPRIDPGVACTSLYHASRGRDCPRLRHEFEFRRRSGFDVEWIEQDELHARFGLYARCAIASRPAARIDPYLATHELLEDISRQGARVHARTRIVRIRANRKQVILETQAGHRVRARHVVMATGYAAQTLLPAPVARNRSTYAFVTNPIDAPHDAEAFESIRHALVWETARPYLYMRATDDGRLMIGGEDDEIDIPARRDAVVGRKAWKLLRKARRRLPDLTLDAAFAWAGTFAETPDGLPFFGPHALTGDRIHYALAYGGNGITFSWIGAGIIADLIQARVNPLSRLFGFSRLHGGQ